MSTAVSPPEKKLVTIAEFLALPDDGKERWLIRGEVWPKEPATTVRNRRHSKIEARVAQLLRNWLDRQPEPRRGTLRGGRFLPARDAGFAGGDRRGVRFGPARRAD